MALNFECFCKKVIKNAMVYYLQDGYQTYSIKKNKKYYDTFRKNKQPLQ